MNSAAPKVDLNADLGEGMSSDAALFKLVDRANIACGGHTGDRDSMQRAVELAVNNGVMVGAHPSYPDREGFGRRRPEGPVHRLYDSLIEQVNDLVQVSVGMGVQVAYIKPHGQLYNDAAEDAALADLLIQVSKEFGGLPIMLRANSPQEIQTMSAGLMPIREGFPDRAYWGDGALVERSMKGALINDPLQVAAQAQAFIHREPVYSIDGEGLVLEVDTLCIHGDSPAALANAKAVYRVLYPDRSIPD